MNIFERSSVLPDIPINITKKSTPIFPEDSMDIHDREVTNLTGLSPISISPSFKIRNVQSILSASRPVYFIPDPKMSTAQSEPNNVGLDTPTDTATMYENV